MDADHDDDLDEFGQQILDGLVEQAVRQGDLDLSGLSDDDAIEKICELITVFMDPEQSTVGIVITHESTLLTEAQRFLAQGENDLAILLFATLIEHKLNALVLAGASRRGLSPETSKKMLRSANFDSKLGWLWELVFGTAFPDDVAVRIKNLTGQRNAYVHYKWPAFEADQEDTDSNVTESLAAQAEDLLNDLEALDDRLIFEEMRSSLPELAAAARRLWLQNRVPTHEP